MSNSIKNALRKAGVSQVELAKKMGMTQASVSSIVTGNPTVSSVRKLAEMLHVPVSELMEEPDNLLHGYLEYKGEIFKISTLEQLASLVQKWTDEREA